MNGKKLIKSFGNFEAKIEKVRKDSNFFRFRLKDIPERLHEEIIHGWTQNRLFWERKEKKCQVEMRLLEEREKKQQQTDSNSDILPSDPDWLKYCSPSYKEKIRERISEKELEEERKQLFNAYSKPKLSGGGIDWRMKKLVHNPNQPGTLTLEVQRLVAKRFQNTQEWIKEREEKEDEQSKEVKKLISSFWSKG